MSEPELKRGISLIGENANQLIRDATILKQSGSYARSYTLFQLAAEEFGKATIVFIALIKFYQGERVDLSFFQKKKHGFLDHKKKTRQALVVQSFLINVFMQSTGTELEKEPFDEQKFIYEADDMKNLSLYTSINDDRFVLPSDIVTKQMVDNIEYRAAVTKPIVEIILSTDWKESSMLFKDVLACLNED